MTWAPEKAASDIRPIVRNLLQYFKDHQTEAWAWASPGVELADFKEFYPTAEMLIKKDFPHFGIVKRSFTTDNANSGLIIEYQLIWQFEVQTNYAEADRSEKLLALQSEVDCRALALESMFLNCPTLTLFDGVVGASHGYRNVGRTDPLEVAIGNTAAVFNVQQTALLRFTENP